jgi:D-lactate dehydrogenase
MQRAIIITRRYDREYLRAASEAHGHELRFLESRLTGETATLAAGHRWYASS